MSQTYTPVNDVYHETVNFPDNGDPLDAVKITLDDIADVMDNAHYIKRAYNEQHRDDGTHQAPVTITADEPDVSKLIISAYESEDAGTTEQLRVEDSAGEMLFTVRSDGMRTGYNFTSQLGKVHLNPDTSTHTSPKLLVSPHEDDASTKVQIELEDSSGDTVFSVETSGRVVAPVYEVSPVPILVKNLPGGSFVGRDDIGNESGVSAIWVGQTSLYPTNPGTQIDDVRTAVRDLPLDPEDELVELSFIGTVDAQAAVAGVNAPGIDLYLVKQNLSTGVESNSLLISKTGGGRGEVTTGTISLTISSAYTYSLVAVICNGYHDNATDGSTSTGSPDGGLSILHNVQLSYRRAELH